MTSVETNQMDSSSDLSISQLLEQMRVAETCDRYDDMAQYAKRFVHQKSAMSEPLDTMECNLFSTAYKNVMGVKRASWRTLKGGFDDADTDLLDNYTSIVEEEIVAVCQEVIELLTDHLCPMSKDQDDAEQVFYLKMLADYYRYMAEVTQTDESRQRARTFYEQALEIAEAKLKVTNSVRLGLALNYSVTLQEILNETQKAHDFAKRVFDEAVACIDELDDSHYKDSTLVMQLLRDNYTLWAFEIEQMGNPDAQNDDDYNDGIDIMKYGKRVKAKKHDPNSEQDMHDLKSDMQKLGLMAQNVEDPMSEKDKLRNGLVEVFREVTHDEMYNEVIELILEYEAYINLSQFRCVECSNYSGCDVFEYRCSQCFEEEHGVEERKRRCKEDMEDIAVRIEWISRCQKWLYYTMISMPSMCSMKIMFRILNRNGYNSKFVEPKDGNRRLFMVEMCDRYFKDGEEPSDEIKEKMKKNERCITDFGVVAMTRIEKSL